MDLRSLNSRSILLHNEYTWSYARLTVRVGLNEHIAVSVTHQVNSSLHNNILNLFA